MHVRELVELGALVAAHSNRLAVNATLLNQRHTERYWLASRCRHEHWMKALSGFDRAGRAAKVQVWPFVKTVFEEVIASEILTRTWAAVGCSFDRQRGTSALGPFLRSVLVNHSEARHRVLGMLLREEGFSRRDGARLNQLRRRTERWTDLMLGYLAVDFEAEEFAFDPNLVREYSLERDDSSSSVISDPSWQLTLASLRSAYQANLSAESPHAGLNQRIATSVLACFDSDLFDSTGVFQSHWLLRLHHVTDDTLGLIDDLLACEAATDEPFPLGR